MCVSDAAATSTAAVADPVAVAAAIADAAAQTRPNTRGTMHAPGLATRTPPATHLVRQPVVDLRVGSWGSNKLVGLIWCGFGGQTAMLFKHGW